jgi:glutamate formiminotransferase/formiminotetrahydrofolate cyclodeaminase
MAAFSLPKSTDEEKQARKAAIENATRHAIDIPFQVMESSLGSMTMIKAMAETGNPNSASDAGVGALCARAAVSGAYLNVKINAAGLEDKNYATLMIEKGAELEAQALEFEKSILEIVNQKILS